MLIRQWSDWQICGDKRYGKNDFKENGCIVTYDTEMAVAGRGYDTEFIVFRDQIISSIVCPCSPHCIVSVQDSRLRKGDV